MIEKTYIQKVVKYFNEIIKSCDICPHECHVDRTAGERGFCRVTDVPMISSHGPHFGEERELVGSAGSGTVFFTCCNLKCKFCQNYDISQMDRGHEVASDKLASIFLSLQRRGCHNINLVTPTHQMPVILEAFDLAVSDGLDLPVVYNCGGYEKVETIKKLEGIIDIYMPDFKWGTNELGKKYSGASDYADRAKAALIEMHRQVGVLKTDRRGVATKGLLIRHLVMPDMFENSKLVLDFIAENLSKDTYVNIMDQYHPAYKAREMPEINKRISYKDYLKILNYAESIGLHRGF